MTSELIIKNGISKIRLIPENEFEKTMLKDGEKMNLKSTISDVSTGIYTEPKYELEIRLTKKLK